MSSTVPTPPATAANPRRHDLDALRAIAMLLGVVLHAAMAYLPERFWVVADSQTNELFGVLLAAIHGFRMPLFFLLSGFFTMMLFRRRGLGSLLKHRAKRILLPLLIGAFTILPLMSFVQSHVTATTDQSAVDIRVAAAFGDVDQIQQFIDAGVDADEAGADGSTPLMLAAIFGEAETFDFLLEQGADVHAKNHRGDQVQTMLGLDKGVTEWVAGMVQVDVDYDAVIAGRDEIKANLERRSITLETNTDETSESAKASPVVQALRGIWLALTTIPVWQHLWFLNFLVWLVIGFAIVAGFCRLVGIGRTPAWIVGSAFAYALLIPLTMIPEVMMQQPGPRFGPDTSVGLLPMPHVLLYYAIFFFAGALYFDADDREGKMGRWWMITLPLCLFVLFPVGMMVSEKTDTAQKIVSLLVQSAYVWLMTFGLMGLFRQLLSKESRTMRYLSDSSYWLYVAHLPLVIWIQSWFRDMTLSPWLKFAAVTAIASVILLASYQLLVRHTPIGTLLNGKRKKNVPTDA